MTALVVLFLALVQFRPQPSPGVVQTGDQYGEPRDADLSSIAHYENSYQRDHVRTRGTFGMLASGQYFTLREGSAEVLVIPGHGLVGSDLQTLLGARVEARGIVRKIRPKEYIMGRDADLVEDPNLPVLPAPHVALPKISLTLLSISDMEPGSARAGGARAAAPLAAILADPARFAGKPIRILGQFRGANLFGDLPESSRRRPSDWVLKDGDSALWVIEREPKGKGFALDPGYKGDASRWLEVEGKPEVVNGVLYLRASKVTLAQRRKPEQP